MNLQDMEHSFTAKGVVLMFTAEPNLASLAAARRLLDQVTDELVIKAIEVEVNDAQQV